MDEYIKRNELAEMIEKNVNLPYGEGYTGKDHELVDWCKGECIRMAHCLPFACDVVPKSEWISVDERLPDRNGRYLTHCNIEGQSLVCILHYCKVGGFNEGTVTHWMPLPEPPKMKGGE